MMTNRPLAVLALMLSMLAAAHAQDRKLTIAVVGANVPTTEGQPHSSPCERDVPGGVLLYGAQAALNDEPQLKDLIELKSWDDGGCVDTAKAIARRVTGDPRVLAVIGHATSATTKEAALWYAQAGIPVLAPMATSPMIHFPYWPNDKNTRLANVFRLPPGDQQVQGPAIAYLAATLRVRDKGQDHAARRPILIKDVSARDYSGPLVSRIAEFLPNIGSPIELHSSEGGVDQAVREVGRAQPDLVIFCGYPSTFQSFVKALGKQFPGAGRPTLLLTDGANSKNLDVTPFQAYLTYPVPDITAGKYPEVLKTDIIDRKQDGYEIYAYDAVRILAQVIRSCQSQRKAVSRSCILDQLRNRRPLLIGAAGSYLFVEGENPLSSYYIYEVNGALPVFSRAIEFEELESFKRKQEQKK